VLSFASEVFATQQNLFNVTRNFAFVAIIAIGMTAVIVCGGIDLSVGAVLVLSGMVIGMTMSDGLSIWLAVPLALGVSLAVGAFNGFMIAYIGVPPFVVTLGMLSIARSLAMVLSNNRMVYQFGPDQPQLLALGGGFVELPLPFVDAVRIPSPVLFLLVLLVVTALAFRWTRWGRYLFAIGGNERAATLTGVPVKRIKISVYMFCSFCAGIAGILEVGWLGTITTSLGQGMELTVIAAAVIGGANLSGGIGTAFGAVVGAALIEVIRNSLTLLGISTFWQGTFVGGFIIVAVLFDRLRARGANE
jgi:ribose transport system permease protein